MRILIVDDEPVSLNLLSLVLQQSGYEVDCAHDGAEALTMLAQGQHALVISDWEMPRMNGLELCRAIRARDYRNYVYVILLTARERCESVVEGLAAGADDFITKPFNPEEMTARIRVAQRILSLEMRDVTIFALAKLAESRDTETGAHLERVQSYCHLLAHHLWRSNAYPDEVDADFVNLIHETSPLHDIGKVAIPDCVLLKPGRLSDDEFAVMKTHATLGANTLEAAAAKCPKANYLRIAEEIARSHHEKWDGSGYPNRLAGSDSPLSGRIVALADVYDALTSKRVYKTTYPHMAGKGIIVEGKGSHFDPAIVDAFLAVEVRFVEVHQRFSDNLAEAA